MLTWADRLPFSFELHGNQLRAIEPSGHRREVDPPWRKDARFVDSLIDFLKLTQKPAQTDEDRKEQTEYARVVGEKLFDLLFPVDGDDHPGTPDRDLTQQRAIALESLLKPGRDLGTIIIRSDDDFILSLPWELICRDGAFLVRDARLDLVRTTLTEVDASLLLPEPRGQFRLLVNVSAPEGGHLHYEEESYRIVRALLNQQSVVHTELGTLDDLVETARHLNPPATGIHFSGHGHPGSLLFEDELGEGKQVMTRELIEQLRRALPHGIPPFFYLASCHGNTPPDPEEQKAGSSGSAVQLHKAGVAEVIGYFGPIQDSLSTAAEAALYKVIAEGMPTRYAVRMARQALTRPSPEVSRYCRIREFGGPEAEAEAKEALTAQNQNQSEIEMAQHAFPFAWTQLTFYHRGPEHPLGLPVTDSSPRNEPEIPTRELTELKKFGRRRLLKTGFIGRRRELHRIRRLIRDGQRVFVFQGLGGLGKTELAWKALPLLAEERKACVLWCDETEKADDPIANFTGQLLEYCRDLFGVEWEPISQFVDRQAGDSSLERFSAFLLILLRKVHRLVLYLDNLESLLVAPRKEEVLLDTPPNPEAFANWRSEDLRELWQRLTTLAENGQSLYLVASCRYRNNDYAKALIPVSALPPDALYRMTAWFRWLRRLSPCTRLRLSERLHGHPRAVEFADDLISATLRGRIPAETFLDPEKEWSLLVEPVLPKVRDQIWDDLLLNQIWQVVLDEPCRRMLYRMTLLRLPWDREMMEHLGEEEEPLSKSRKTADRLADTSLLEQLECRDSEGSPLLLYALHPPTAEFVKWRFGDDPGLRLETHLRVGTFLEGQVIRSGYIEAGIESGWHLFQSKEYDRACELLGAASVWIRNHGRAHEGLAILLPFLETEAQHKLDRGRLGSVLGTIGVHYLSLGEDRKAIGYFQQHLVISRETGDRQSEGNALGNLGIAHKDLGEVRKSIGYFEQQLAISHEIGDRRGKESALGGLGNAYSCLREISKAIGYYEQALVISREIGDRRGEGTVLGDLGLASVELGETRKSVGYFERALVIHREIGDRRGEGMALGNLGLAYANLGEVGKAIAYCEQALVIHREVGDRRGEGTTIENLGGAYHRLGEISKAMGHYEQALVIHRETGDRLGEGCVLGKLGAAYADVEDRENAKRCYEMASAIGRQIEDPQMISLCEQALKTLE